MRYLSVCSGIEAATVAWHPLGWTPLAFSEIESFPRAVLRHHYPDVPLFGDFTCIRNNHLRRLCGHATVDVLIGGTPCQSFSVAGLRKGLDDPRGNLALAFIALVRRTRPRWVVWENVPGVLSSGGGGDLAAFLGGMAGIGYFGAWRVLDAQYFGLAQRRRRVFAIFHPGDWRPPAAVLLEPLCLCGDPPPRREAGEGVAPSLAARTRGGGGLGTDTELDGGLIYQDSEYGVKGYQTAGALRAGRIPEHQMIPEVAWALQERDHKGADSDTKPGHLIPFDTTQITHPENRSNPHPGDPSPSLKRSGHAPAVATSVCLGSDPIYGHELAMPQTTRSGDPGVVQRGMSVRRLTPTECARLQGFPDDYTCVPYRWHRPSECPDGPRYKALGNTMAVPVVRWIGERIALFEEAVT